MSQALNFEETTPICFTLPNGIRVIHRACSGQVSCCGYVVNAGSRHDSELESGIAHFTEHMLFKGTSHRKAHHILNRMEAVGAELNAYTTKEEIFVYAQFLEKDYLRATDLLTDLFFNSVFPESEIEKERLVILDEINSYEDSPSELIFDDFEDLLFAHHPIGRKILGTPESLERFNQETFKTFHAQNFKTDNIVFFSQSSIPFKQWNKIIERVVGQIPTNTQGDRRVITKPIPQTGLRTSVDKDTHQAHVLLGTRSYDFNDNNRVGMYLLNNILGGPGMNSRLNIALRERLGLVYSVESNVTSYSDSGVFSIYFGTDHQNLDRCMNLVKKELKNLRTHALTPLQLHAAQKQLFGQMMISSEQKEGSSLSMGKSMLHFNRFDSLKEISDKVLSFKASELQNIANELLDFDKMCILEYR